MSPADPGGNFCESNSVTSVSVYVLAGIGQVHGIPYLAKYLGQASAQVPQTLS